MKNIFSILLVCLIIAGCDLRPPCEDIGFWKKKGTRVYSIYTRTADFKVIKEYARKKPWTPGRITVAYFFNDRDETPDISMYKIGYQIPKRYDPYMVAKYQRLGNGKEKFVRNPPPR